MYAFNRLQELSNFREELNKTSNIPKIFESDLFWVYPEHIRSCITCIAYIKKDLISKLLNYIDYYFIIHPDKINCIEYKYNNHLFLACKYIDYPGCLKIIKILIKRGIDVNARDKYNRTVLSILVNKKNSLKYQNLIFYLIKRINRNSNFKINGKFLSEILEEKGFSQSIIIYCINN